MSDGYILFDIPPGSRPTDSAFLETLGHAVMVCHGPQGGTLCPILTGEGCELAEKAHGIVFELDLDRPQHRAILARYKESLRDDVPVRVVVRREQGTRYAHLLQGLKTLTHEPDASDLDGLAAEVEATERYG